MNEKVFLISLGCDKNLVDSERMLGSLEAHDITPTDSPEEADFIIVNTCGFIKKAVEEAIEEILALSLWKTKGRCKKLVVTGCMVQRYGKKLPDLLPEVDFFLGTSHYCDIAKVLKDSVRGKILISPPEVLEPPLPRLISTPPSYAYLKIAEGCSNRCSYCMIPKIRGSFRSRPLDELLKEVRLINDHSIPELIIIAQDITSYGIDRNSPGELLKLIEKIEKFPNIKRIRLLYAYPARIQDDLLKLMRDSKKVVPYLDVPFQHVSPKILKLMGRNLSPGSHPKEVVEKLRSFIPNITIRTTFIVGFPGEGDKEFEELLSFVKDMELEHVGAFAFSPEEGTKAKKFPEQVPENIKRKRLKALYDLQKRISRKKLAKLKNTVQSVIIDGFVEEFPFILRGRLPSQAPDVDGTVIITSGTAPVGSIVPAKITKTRSYDLEAEIIDSSN